MMHFGVSREMAEYLEGFGRVIAPGAPVLSVGVLELDLQNWQPLERNVHRMVDTAVFLDCSAHEELPSGRGKAI